jgi:hypothetical protein
MTRWIAMALLPLALSGCGATAAIAPLEGLLGATGGNGSAGATLTLVIDQAHGTLTMGSQPTATTVVATPAPVATPPQPVMTPTPAPSGGSPVVVMPAPIQAPKPVPTVP